MGGGFFVVFEGIDGSGKTTQRDILARVLEARGERVHVTREPSDGAIGKLIRERLAGKPEDAPHWRAMAMLFAADRLEHLRTEIEPALAEGAIVLCDRYVASNIAYQTASAAVRGLDRPIVRDYIRMLNHHARVADLQFLISVTVEEATTRRRARGREELFDEALVQRTVLEEYRDMGGAHASLTIVNGARSPEEVHGDVLKIFDWASPFDRKERAATSAT